MITERDLLEAIAECQGEREPNARTCMKLAAFYTILDHMQEEKEAKETKYLYSSAPAIPSIAPTATNTVSYEGESDFAKKIYGMDSAVAWSVIDELMDTLSVLNPSLYNGVMRKISQL